MRDLGERIIVYLVEQRPVGTKFPRRRAAWPLHVTLVPWFRCDPGNDDVLLAALRRYLSGRRPFAAHVGGEALFGPAQDIPVHVIADQVQLERLHQDLTGIIQACGTSPSDPWREQQTFRAHITQHTSGGATRRVAPGDRLAVATVTVARLLDDHGIQVVEIMEHMALGGGNEAAA